MKKLIISLLFFLAPLSAQAEVTTDIFMKYKIHATSPYPDVSSLALGAIDHRYVVKFKYEGGIILDRRVPNKVGYGNASFGFQPEWGPIGVFFYQGAALLTGTDKFLSTNFQFTEELGLIFRGKDNSFIAMSFGHLSNGGLRLPNIGKDFGILTVGFGL